METITMTPQVAFSHSLSWFTCWQQVTVVSSRDACVSLPFHDPPSLALLQDPLLPFSFYMWGEEPPKSHSSGPISALMPGTPAYSSLLHWAEAITLYNSSPDCSPWILVLHLLQPARISSWRYTFLLKSTYLTVWPKKSCKLWIL